MILWFRCSLLVIAPAKANEVDDLVLRRCAVAVSVLVANEVDDLLLRHCTVSVSVLQVVASSVVIMALDMMVSVGARSPRNSALAPDILES